MRPLILFDDKAGNAVTEQFAGHRQSDGTGTGDQGSGFGLWNRVHIGTPRIQQ